MPTRMPSFVSTVRTPLVAAAIALGTIGPAPAGDGCIERPNQNSAEGVHWYYHFDRVRHRKCWFLGTTGVTASEPEMPAEQSGSTSMPPFSSLFSALFGGTAGTATPVTDAKTREPRIIQVDPARVLSVEDIVPKRQPSIPEERAEPRPSRPLNRARRNVLFQEFLRWEEARRSVRGTQQTPSP
jgi:hypothetical protein